MKWPPLDRAPQTVIKYMTDGMLLREFLSEPDLKSYSVLVRRVVCVQKQQQSNKPEAQKTAGSFFVLFLNALFIRNSG
jgi:hypothetical protein